MKTKTENKDATELGEALRLFRVFHDMTLSQLAKELDVSASFLSAIETGKKKPNLSLVDKYAEVFNTSPSAIMFFREELGSSRLPASVSSQIRAKLIKFMQAIEHGRN
ncbi:MAG: hypothetical protein A2428_08765 [Bdellovibrionales bacterium RIFOXYC1_FULL_54_43]|nr:MAG: hypothetical protein A2428_08765 [Bdellovibrionales bacterium RIFOXYC1_FULL_54_43]OFZ81364.1 MAG: hypothetical protein A2603_08370 [Bdellovibrionales bacterium RIFOXYD1_FULL_55_31]